MTANIIYSVILLVKSILRPNLCTILCNLVSLTAELAPLIDAWVSTNKGRENLGKEFEVQTQIKTSFLEI
jgi:hypothetical protein